MLFCPFHMIFAGENIQNTLCRTALSIIKIFCSYPALLQSSLRNLLTHFRSREVKNYTFV